MHTLIPHLMKKQSNLFHQTGFSPGDKLYAFIRGFYGLKGLQIFSRNKCQPSFDHLSTNVLR